MRIYDFQPPETFRIAWASEESKRKWEGIISVLANTFQRAELLTVVNREREAGIFTVDLEDLILGSPYSQTLTERGICFALLGYTPKTNTYSNAFTPATDMNNAQARILAMPIGGHIRDLGEMLGYPKCCIKFFKRYWDKAGHRDTIPFQYLATPPPYHPYCNVMLKGLGIRAVPHLPCSPNCLRTIDFAGKFLKYFTAQEYGYLESLLTMRMEYSSYHGYAEVKTNDFKLLFNSVALADKLTIICEETTITPMIGSPLNNGFYSLKAQMDAHDWLIEKIYSVIDAGALTDLGCGDGTLLARLKKTTGLKLAGIDSSPDKCNLAKKLLGPEVNILCADINLLSAISADFILIAEQRLTENPYLLNKLKGMLLVYNYSTKEFKTLDRRINDETAGAGRLPLRGN